MTTTLRVRLADAPTDVLVWLVDRPPHLWWSVGQIAAATAPDDADNAQASVADALSMLRTMGMVVQNRETRAWAATTEGQEAVEKARATPVTCDAEPEDQPASINPDRASSRQKTTEPGGLAN